MKETILIGKKYKIEYEDESQRIDVIRSILAEKYSCNYWSTDGTRVTTIPEEPMKDNKALERVIKLP